MNLGRETELIEFKESTSELKEGVRSLVSRLNKHKNGTLYFGVKNNGDVCGQQVGDHTLREISQAISFNVEPSIIPIISVLDGPKAGLEVIKVEVSGTDIPYSAYGQYLIRAADEDKKITRQALRKRFSSAGFDFISEMKSPREDLTFEQFKSFLSSKGFHVVSNQSLIKNRGRKNERNQFNLRAFLLSDQSNISIKVVRFSGKDKTVRSQRTEFGNQCLLIALKKAWDYVETLNETNVFFGPNGREDTPLFDNEAFEEAWKNACVHNSWIDRVPPAIYLFSDRREIISYGGLPFGRTREEFYSGESHPVNHELWAIFNSVDLAEQTGHGIPTIISRYGKEAIKVSENFITVTIPFAFKPAWALAAEASTAKHILTETQNRILDSLAQQSEISGAELSGKLNVSVSAIRKNIAFLRDNGFIERIGTNRKGYWKIKER